jgi:hypothetical protein
VSSDVSGQAFALTVLTPIAAGEQEPLRAYLEGLRAGGARGPLARLPRTHFGRWVIVPDFVADAVPDPAHLDVLRRSARQLPRRAQHRARRRGG